MKHLFFYKLAFTFVDGQQFKKVSFAEAEQLCKDLYYGQMEVHSCHSATDLIVEPNFLNNRQNKRSVIVRDVGVLREYVYTITGLVIPELSLYDPAVDSGKQGVYLAKVNKRREKLHNVEGFNQVEFINDNPGLPRLKRIPVEVKAVEETEAFNKLPLQKRINYFMKKVSDDAEHVARVERIKNCLEIADKKRRDECLKNNCKL
jgi:hypothetical protein